MVKIPSRLFFYGTLTIFLGLFFFKAIVFLDPDFGWHIKMGEYITRFGIPSTEPFSYTMPSFPYIDHEWLTDVLLFTGYTLFGYFGLAVIFSLLMVLALRISLSEISSKRVFLISLLLGTGVVYSFFGVRPQVITWLLLSVLFKVLFADKKKSKAFYFLPILFIFWANLHGGFVSGLLVLWIFLITKWVRKQRINLVETIIGLLSIGATFLNPYGPRLYVEIWRSLSDSSLRFSIAEWYPMLFLFEPAFIFFLTLTLVVIFVYRKKFDVERLVLFAFLLINALASQRNVPLWLFSALPLFSFGFDFLANSMTKTAQTEWRFLKVYKILFALVFLLFSYRIVSGMQQAFDVSENHFYPKDAISFLQKQRIQGQIFSLYDWGGYLDWKLPEKKVFVDGRMPSLRWKAPKQESNWAFEEYRQIVFNHQPFQKTFQKYAISYVLWSKPNEDKSWLNALLSKISFPIFPMHDTKQKTLTDRLKDAGWQKIYEDNISEIWHQETKIK